MLTNLGFLEINLSSNSYLPYKKCNQYPGLNYIYMYVIDLDNQKVMYVIHD